MLIKPPAMGYCLGISHVEVQGSCPNSLNHVVMGAFKHLPSTRLGCGFHTYYLLKQS